MLYGILLIVIGILILKIYRDHNKIKKISRQVNQVLFQQSDLYVQQFQEGELSILESEIGESSL